MQTKKIVAIGIVVAAVVLVTLINSLSADKAKTVETAPLATHAIEASILASGTLTHEDEVRLTSEEIGKVKALYVVEGDRVEKGQLVLEIDAEARMAELEQSQAAVRMQEIAIERQALNVETLEQQLGRKQELHKRKLLDDDSFEKFSHELALAKIDLATSKESLVQRKAQLEQSQDRVRKTKVYSPLSGVITSLDIKVGETAITGTTNIEGSSLMTVANPSSIQTEVYVDEADVANVAIGQRAEVFAIAYPDTPVTGVVTSVAVSAKQAKGKQGLSFAVKIKLDKNDAVVLRPGMSCRAEIFTANKQEVLAVPIKALLAQEDLVQGITEYFVFLDDEGVAKKVLVTPGISDDENQEILSGLTEGSSVIVGPNATLRGLKPGDAITVDAG